MFAALALPLLLVLPQGTQKPAALQVDQRAVFALLDEFDSLDTSRLPFVVVITTRGTQRTERYGFLESAEGSKFRVRYVDLCREVLRVARETPAQPGVSFEPCDLRACVSRMVSEREQELSRGADRSYYLRPERPMSPDMEMLLLARACARAGLTAEVDALWRVLPEECRSCEAPRRGNKPDLGDTLDNRLLLDYTDCSLTWDDLLARHEKWLALFPGHWRSKTVRERRDGIVSLQAATKARQHAGQVDARDLRNLAFELHNESHPVGSDFMRLEFVTPCDGRDVPGPWDQLRACDVAAVPSLVDALDDSMPTRSIEYYCRFGGSFRVRPLGDVATSALEDITGTTGLGPYGWMAWYEEASQDGPRPRLERQMARFDRWAMAAFLRRWPKDVDPVIEALQHPTRWPLEGLRDPRLCVILDLLLRPEDAAPHPKLLAFVADSLLRSSEPRDQYELSRILCRCGRTEDLAVVLAAWSEQMQHMDPAACADPEGHWNTAEDVCGLLVEHANAATWRGLAAACTSAATRRLLAKQLVAYAQRPLPPWLSPTERAAAKDALRECLRHLLADDAIVRKSARLGRNGLMVTLEPATCAEIAVCLLADPLLAPDGPVGAPGQAK